MMNKSFTKYLAGFMLCAAMFALTAATLAERANYNDGNEFSSNVIVTDTLTVDTSADVAALAVSGTATVGTVVATTGTITTLGSTTATLALATITTANTTTENATTLNVATTFTNNGIEIMPLTAISITSPTVTITAAGARLISLTTDTSQTGIIINGGTTGQILTVRGTSDSETSRIDDGTSYTLAGNWTGGLGDSLTMRCLDGGDAISSWEEVSRAEN